MNKITKVILILSIFITPLTVAFAETKPFIEITSPKKSVNWEFDKTQTIKWDSKGLKGNIEVALHTKMDGGKFCPIGKVSSKKKSFTFNPSTKYECKPGYFLKEGEYIVQLKNTEKIFDTSDKFFIKAKKNGKKDKNISANTPASSPSIIKIISPKGGESYKFGDVLKVKWDLKIDVDDTEKIYFILEKDNGKRFDFGKALAKTGYYEQSLPLDLPSDQSGKFRVLISDDPRGIQTDSILAKSKYFEIYSNNVQTNADGVPIIPSNNFPILPPKKPELTESQKVINQFFAAVSKYNLLKNKGDIWYSEFLDLDNNETISLTDLQLMKDAFEKRNNDVVAAERVSKIYKGIASYAGRIPGDDNYPAEYDLNNNGVISLSDLQALKNALIEVYP